MNLKPILHAILDDYALPIGGDHGVAHWARVLENGLRLAEETGANVEVVQLFAVLHDSRRINEVTDPEHGSRAAEFAFKIRGSVFDLDDHDFQLLYRACEGHTHERNNPDVTIQTCWDSDRLDLGRVGIMPHPSRLCTEVAKRPETIKWADGRAVLRQLNLDFSADRVILRAKGGSKNDPIPKNFHRPRKSRYRFAAPCRQNPRL